ncbi:MAG: ROK family protein [Pseudomonadales bacterium]|nr:ROK family protein [Pseudomonadales bacterium]
MIRIGIDLGGSKIEGIALDRAGAVLWRERVASARDDYPGTLDAIAMVVERIETELGCKGTVGVGTPGSPSPLDGRMRNCNSTWLNGTQLAQDLAVRLRREVRIANDADCFTLSEATDGAAAAAASVFGVILGTGVGGGVCVDGRLLAGPNAIAGEWGHNRFAGPRGRLAATRACYCGRSDCIETWLSGPGLLRSYRELATSGGDAGSAAHVVALAESGDSTARAALDLYIEQLAFALAQVINLLDPHAIVCGGGLSNIERLYAEIPLRWTRYVFSDAVRTPLLRARFGDSSGVRGAAWLFPLLP